MCAAAARWCQETGRRFPGRNRGVDEAASVSAAACGRSRALAPGWRVRPRVAGAAAAGSGAARWAVLEAAWMSKRISLTSPYVDRLSCGLSAAARAAAGGQSGRGRPPAARSCPSPPRSSKTRVARRGRQCARRGPQRGRQPAYVGRGPQRVGAGSRRGQCGATRVDHFTSHCAPLPGWSSITAPWTSHAPRMVRPAPTASPRTWSAPE